VSQLNETIRIVLGYAFAFFVVWVCIQFLDRAFLDPNTAAIPAEQSGLIVGGLMAIISSAATFVFGQAIMNAAARSASTATQAGVNAALTQPPSNIIPPTVSTEAKAEG
jgi:membrane associated rhomboid family serine protease